VLKVKVGKDFAREKVQIEMIRQQYPALQLYADANQCYTLAEAKDYLPQLAEMGIQWCEEALPVQRIRDRVRLRSEAILPLIADDSAFTLEDLERELAFDSFDVLNIKTARNGFSEGRAMLRLAQAAGKGMMVGSQAGSLLGCLHALLFSGQAGIDYPTEGTFYLKVPEQAAALRIENACIDLAQAQTVLDTFVFA
jgi:L-alanine-DL-glutamate epimerase-like enolase superfamily enzyme